MAIARIADTPITDYSKPFHGKMTPELIMNMTKMRKFIEYIAKLFGESVLFKDDATAEKMLMAVEIENLKKQNSEMRNDLRELCVPADPSQMAHSIRWKWHLIFNLEDEISNMWYAGDYEKAYKGGIFSNFEEHNISKKIREIATITVYSTTEIQKFMTASGLPIQKVENVLLMFSKRNISMADLIMLYHDKKFRITDSGIDFIQ